MSGLFRLLAVVVIGILLYNYFLGDAEEKENAKVVFGQVRNLGESVGDLLRTEKDKYEEGKYDAAIDQMSDLLKAMKSEADKDGGAYSDRVAELDADRQRIEGYIAQLKALEAQNAQIAEATAQWEDYDPDSEFTHKGGAMPEAYDAAMKEKAAVEADVEQSKAQLKKEFESFYKDLRKVAEEMQAAQE